MQQCGFDVCDKKVRSKGLCNGHYEQQRTGLTLTPLRARRDKIYPCEFDGCVAPSMAHQLCDGHYQQKRKGQPLTSLQPRRLGPLAERVWSEVDKSGPVPVLVKFKPGTAEVVGTMKRGPCWLWTGLLDGSGYGRLWNTERVAASHQVAYEVAHGPVPGGLEIDHLCNSPRCVNPDHLEAVTHTVNIHRRDQRRKAA